MSRVLPARFSWGVYGIVVLLRVLSIIWAYGQLPERVASHFGASGAADGWMSRTGYLVFDVGISALLLVGIPLLSVLAKGSGMGLNIPNKEYWMRPENRPELHRLLTGDLVYIACASGLFMTWLTVSVVQANRLSAPTLGAMNWVPITAFLVVILGRAVWMRKRYAIPA